LAVEVQAAALPETPAQDCTVDAAALTLYVQKA